MIYEGSVKRKLTSIVINTSQIQIFLSVLRFRMLDNSICFLIFCFDFFVGQQMELMDVGEARVMGDPSEFSGPSTSRGHFENPGTDPSMFFSKKAKINLVTSKNINKKKKKRLF